VNPVLFGIGGAVAVALLLAGGTAVAGQIVLHHTLLTDDGTVSLDGDEGADPRMLARDAGLEIDHYALARMIWSEMAGLPQIALWGVGWAATNEAGARGLTVADLLLRSSGAGDGFFGRQSQGRFASTAKDPPAAAFAAAAAVLSRDVADPTGGARQWDSPQAYPTEERAAEIAARRIDAGNVKVLLPGVPERKLRFWRRT